MIINQRRVIESVYNGCTGPGGSAGQVHPGKPDMRALLLLLLCLFCCCPQAVAAPLGPEELLLVFKSNDPDSRVLAQYYAEARGVPADRLLGLDIQASGEEIPANEFERSIRGPIRARLEQAGMGDKVRCLVTFYGLPIRVGPQVLTPEQAKLLEKWRGEFREGLKDFEQAIGELAPAATRPTFRAKGKPLEPEAEFQRLYQLYGQARAAAFERAKAQAAAPEGQAQLKKLLEVMQAVEGLAGIIEQPNLKVQAPGADADGQLERLKQAVKLDDERVREVFERGIEDPARDEARKLVRQDHGLGAWLHSLNGDMSQLRTDETQAALDSELALVWWDRYPKHRWIPNPMNWRNRAEQARASRQPQLPKVLMVSRIDGPTPAIARGLIDKALAGEKAGPTGKVYIDARGLSSTTAGFGPYDEYLRRIAGTIRTKTTLPVRLDNRAALFGPGQCPQTVLYCGWYSLRKYIDAFEFVPGAVGYHIASFEAISLKRPGEQGWCKRLLEQGITATLGPVAEPYLQSFPRPDDFFGLLLTGQFTLAEVYADTVPFHSWMLMLIGDPLYRPFANSPQLALPQAMPLEIIPPEYRAATQPQ